MCHLIAPDGLYGYIMRFPADNLWLLWLALLVPVIEVVGMQFWRWTQPVLTPSWLGLPGASTNLQSPRWYLSQLALLWVASSVLVFVEYPTEPAWSDWLQQARQSAEPACASAVASILEMHNRLNIVSILLGVITPIALFLFREVRVTFPARS
jgi:hypothetical protein